jgi:hypothetical protein
MDCRQREHAYRTNPAVSEHLGDRWESGLFIQGGNDQGLLILVYPPYGGLLLWERWNLEGNARIAIQHEAWLACILVIDAETQEIEVHYSAQFACKNAEEFL